MKANKSKKYFKGVKQVIPGGVNSPVRAFKSIGLDPLFISKGAYLWDKAENKFTD